MKTILQALSGVLTIVVFIASGFFAGRFIYPKCPDIEVRTDTIVRVDTLRDTVLIPIDRYITRIDTDTLRLKGDTVFVAVEIPIERKVYLTDEYRAEIEGYKPSLLSMDIYRRTEYINLTEVIKIPDMRRWSLGLTAAYGITYQNGNFVAKPFIGVGINYSIFNFGKSK